MGRGEGSFEGPLWSLAFLLRRSCGPLTRCSENRYRNVCSHYSRLHFISSGSFRRPNGEARGRVAKCTGTGYSRPSTSSFPSPSDINHASKARRSEAVQSSWRLGVVISCSNGLGEQSWLLGLGEQSWPLGLGEMSWRVVLGAGSWRRGICHACSKVLCTCDYARHLDVGATLARLDASPDAPLGSPAQGRGPKNVLV